MLRNYLVTAVRNFTRHKLYSFINIVGLAVGLACAIFIALFIRDELSYDKWIPGADQLYRVEASFAFPGRPVDNFATVPFPLPAAMVAHIPEVQAQTRLTPEKQTIKVGGQLFSETANAVDPNFFTVVQLPLVAGDPATVLSQPDSVVLSQSTARKYFGDANPLGRTIVTEGGHALKVTGIMRDLPHNTQLRIDLAFSNTSKADTTPASEKVAWMLVDEYAYVRLAPGADPAAVLQKFKSVIDASIDARPMHMTGSQLLNVHLTPFGSVHLTPDKLNGIVPSGSWTLIYGFAAIALLILATAGFNFTNLATVRAMTRAREVSMRKVVGARRQQLITQFLGESVLVALLAMVFALALVEVLLPQFDGFLGRDIQYDYLKDWPLTLGVLATAAMVGLLGGIYPAFVLSRFRPVVALSGNGKGEGRALLRTVLVVLQFAISIGLGIATVVVFQQISYAQKIDLGFDHRNVIVVEGADKLTKVNRDSMVQALNGDPAIEDAVQIGAFPFGGAVNIASAKAEGSSQSSIFRVLEMGSGFSQLYHMHLLAGRTLSAARSQDVNTSGEFEEGHSVLLNETAARHLGYTPASAVGKNIVVGNTHMIVAGVLADANMDGVQTVVPPFIYYDSPTDVQTISVRVRPGQDAQALAAVDRIWHRFAPGLAVQRHFLDDSFDKLFAADKKQGEMFALFVAIAIFIACLGLFGLAAFTAERRTREIGIRKAFGARTRDIVWLLLWQFSIPVVVANIIAWPIAWYYLHGWLESYAYRITLDPLYFVTVGIIALVFAWGTVFAHAFRVARANPIRALRYE